MTSKATSQKVVIVAAMHRLADDYAQRHGMRRDSYVSVTESHRLRGFHPDTEIIFLDIGMRFQDSSLIPLLRQRFKNVRQQSQS